MRTAVSATPLACPACGNVDVVNAEQVTEVECRACGEVSTRQAWDEATAAEIAKGVHRDPRLSRWVCDDDHDHGYGEEGHAATVACNEISTAREMGRKAYERGVSRAPSMDSEVMGIAGPRKVGEGAAEILKAWLAGWDAANLRDEANAADQRAADSFERSDTDGFLSQWASGITARLKRLEAQIVEAGGVSTFPGLYDAETGERHRAKIIPTKYGEAWAYVDEAGRLTGEFVGRGPRALKKAGVVEIGETAPAKAITWAPPGSTGLGGAALTQVIKIRTDDGLSGEKVEGWDDEGAADA